MPTLQNIITASNENCLWIHMCKMYNLKNNLRPDSLLDPTKTWQEWRRSRLWNYSHSFSSDDCHIWLRRLKAGAWPWSTSSRSPHKNMGHLSNDHTVWTCLTVLISNMLPFDQRHFQSLGLESMCTMAASHMVEPVSKRGIVQSHPGSNQVGGPVFIKPTYTFTRRVYMGRVQEDI